MKHSYIIALLLAPLALPHQGLGVTEEISLAQTYSPKKKKTTRKTRSSGSKRQKRNSYLSGHGILNFFGSGVGFGYEYRLNRFLSFGGRASYSQAHLQGELGVNTSEVVDANSKRLTGFGKVYLFNFLYLGLNISSSHIVGDYTLRDLNPSGEDTDIPFESIEIHGDLSIGSHWNLKNHFFLAIDWIGYGGPLSSSLTTTSTVSKDQAVEFLTTQNPNARIREELDNQLSLYYFIVHFGYRL